MDCLYCGHQNSEDEPRCQRCARRLPAAPARSAPAGYAGSAALAMAVAPARIQAEPAVAATPERIQVPRQSRLFPEPEGRVFGHRVGLRLTLGFDGIRSGWRTLDWFAVHQLRRSAHRPARARHPLCGRLLEFLLRWTRRVMVTGR